MAAVQAIRHGFMKRASLSKSVTSNLNTWEMMMLDIRMIWRDLYRDRVMILAPLIYQFILQFAPLDLIVYMRRCIDKLMFNLCSGIRFIIRSENRKSPMQSCPNSCHPCGLDLFVEADSFELIQTAKSKMLPKHLADSYYYSCCDGQVLSMISYPLIPQSPVSLIHIT
jgi:hypothetical protein